MKILVDERLPFSDDLIDAVLDFLDFPIKGVRHIQLTGERVPYLRGPRKGEPCLLSGATGKLPGCPIEVYVNIWPRWGRKVFTRPRSEKRYGYLGITLHSSVEGLVYTLAHESYHVRTLSKGAYTKLAGTDDLTPETIAEEANADLFARLAIRAWRETCGRGRQ